MELDSTNDNVCRDCSNVRINNCIFYYIYKWFSYYFKKTCDTSATNTTSCDGAVNLCHTCASTPI